MKKRDQHEKNNVCSNRGSSTDRLSFRFWGGALFNTGKRCNSNIPLSENTNQSAAACSDKIIDTHLILPLIFSTNVLPAFSTFSLPLPARKIFLFLVSFLAKPRLGRLILKGNYQKGRNDVCSCLKALVLWFRLKYQRNHARKSWEEVSGLRIIRAGVKEIET